MSVITDTWRQLVRRRLWPVAVLLLAALAAVPILLAKEPEPVVPAAPPAAAAEKGVLATEPVVALAGPDDETKRRRVLGDRHDIFTPTAKKPKVAVETVETVSPDASPASPDPAPSGGSTPSTPSAPHTPAPVPTEPSEPAEPKPTWPANSLTVRFGDAASGALERMTLRRGRALPDEEAPVAIFLGIQDDGKTAVFLLDAAVQRTGDGTCRPVPESCERIELRAGETEFLDVVAEDGTVSAQYQLDVVALRNVTADKTAATRRITARAAARALKRWRHTTVTGAFARP